MRRGFFSRTITFFEPDTGAASGSGAGGDAGVQSQQGVQQTGAATGQAAGQQAQQSQQTADDKRFTQAELEAIVKDRLAREQRKGQEAADKARQDAEAKALAEQGKYKELADGHAAKIAELEPKAQRYEAALRAQVAELRKDLPEHITALLDKMDAAEQLEYLATNRAKLIATPAAQAAQTAPNINAGGSGRSEPDPKAREQELRQRFRLGR